MGIDRIGKPALPLPPGEGSAAPAPRVAGGAFAERLFGARAPTALSGPEGALERLQAGAIDLEGYLDIKVHEATATMPGLGPAQIDAIRAALRERLSTDPTLVDLVRQATGALQVPFPSNEK